jgi:hypothetical protein
MNNDFYFHSQKLNTQLLNILQTKKKSSWPETSIWPTGNKIKTTDLQVN